MWRCLIHKTLLGTTQNYSIRFSSLGTMDCKWIIHRRSCLSLSDWLLFDFGWNGMSPRILISIPSSRSGASIGHWIKCLLTGLSSLFFLVWQWPPIRVTMLQLVCPTYCMLQDLHVITLYQVITLAIHLLLALNCLAVGFDLTRPLWVIFGQYLHVFWRLQGYVSRWETLVRGVLVEALV